MGTWLVTRPIADAQRFARRIRARGHRAVIAPVLEIVLLSPPGLGEALAQSDKNFWRGFIFTSANAPRLWRQAGGQVGDGLAFTVGTRTALVARKAGWTTIHTADGGDATSLTRLIIAQPDSGPLLHVRNRAAGPGLVDILGAHGISATGLDLYDARPVESFSMRAWYKLNHGKIDGVFLFSIQSAYTFARFAPERALSMPLLCLSDAVAKAATQVGFHNTFAATHPTAEAVLALIDRVGS
ncbi:MAG: uroporphyrinogen-III synthase [Pseudomonadota bacterium]